MLPPGRPEIGSEDRGIINTLDGLMALLSGTPLRIDAFPVTLWIDWVSLDTDV